MLYDNSKYDEITDSDDDTLENYFSSPSTSSSYGRSSNSSIPWAEDAIKQNLDEWMKIERILYGEESPLTIDRVVREELAEWMEKFDHLRVVGSQVPIYYDPYLNGSNDCYEEIIAIDPPPKKLNRTNIDSYNDQFFVRESISALNNNPNLANTLVKKNENIENQIAKCLRITSGPILSRRRPNYESNNLLRFRKTSSPPPPIRLKPIAKQDNQLRIASVRSDTFHIRNKNAAFIDKSVTLKPIILGSELFKIPPILNITHLPEQSEKRTQIQSILKHPPPLKSRISLPTIHLLKPFQSEIIGRSISAIQHLQPAYSLKKSAPATRSVADRYAILEQRKSAVVTKKK